MELAERVSGDTSVGHALAYCQAVEALSGTVVPPRARYLRVILLELERLYNHVGDFGMIANDTGFARGALALLPDPRAAPAPEQAPDGPPAAARRPPSPAASGRTCRPGWTWSPRCAAPCADFDEIVEISLGNTLVADRLEGTGRLTTQTARDHGVLGFVARASGLDVDARRDHPFAAYGELSFRVPVFDSGDVKARTLVRVEEARESVKLIRAGGRRAAGGTAGVGAGPAARPSSRRSPWSRDGGGGSFTG